MDGTGYNDAPKGWRQITEAEFARSIFFSHDPQKTETRQILRVEGKQASAMIPARLYWFWDKTGIAIVNDFWKRSVTYYAFGCDHELVRAEKSPFPGNPDALRCTKCDFVCGRPDSSG